MNRKIAILVICVAMCGACVHYDELCDPTYSDALSSAVDAWEESIGPVSDECLATLAETTLNEVDEFDPSCLAVESSIDGCYLPHVTIDGKRAEVDEIQIRRDLYPDERVRVKVHEDIHAIYRCVYRKGDPAGHTDSRLWYEFGDQSVESRGIAGLCE